MSPDIVSLLQTFGFPIVSAVVVGWAFWHATKERIAVLERLVNNQAVTIAELHEDRLRRAADYANSYAKLAEQVTEAVEQHNLLLRQWLRLHGQEPWSNPENENATPIAHPVIRPDRHRTPLPFSDPQNPL